MLHPRYKKKTDYCCCTGTVHCNYCAGQGKPPHLTVDRDFNTILIADKEIINNSRKFTDVYGNTTIQPRAKAEPINELEELKMNPISTQNEAINAIKSQFYIIGSVDVAGNLSFSANPVIQPSASSARTECKRLASITPGKMYVFVQLRGAELIPNNTVSI